MSATGATVSGVRLSAADLAVAVATLERHHVAGPWLLWEYERGARSAVRVLRRRRQHERRTAAAAARRASAGVGSRRAVTVAPLQTPDTITS